MLKVLTNDLKSPYKSFDFSDAVNSGKVLHCPDFNNDQKVSCAKGFYATKIDGLFYAFRHRQKHRVFEVEVGGKKVEFNIFKRRYENIKFSREVSYDEIKKLALAEEENLGYKLSEILFPINPFEIKNKELSHKQMQKLLTKWVSVGTSAWASVEASVGASIGDFVWASVRASVWASFRASFRSSFGDFVDDFVDDFVWASVEAYLSSLFPQIKKWKYVEHKSGENPFKSCIDLWMSGYVPSFDGKTWRLHARENADIVFEMNF